MKIAYLLFIKIEVNFFNPLVLLCFSFILAPRQLEMPSESKTKNICVQLSDCRFPKAVDVFSEGCNCGSVR